MGGRCGEGAGGVANISWVGSGGGLGGMGSAGSGGGLGKRGVVKEVGLHEEKSAVHVFGKAKGAGQGRDAGREFEYG